MCSVSFIQEQVMSVIKDPAATHEQTVHALAKLAENLLPYPEGAPEEFAVMSEQGLLCDLNEGHAPYAPRYVLPDYSKLLRGGCAFLRLLPADNLREALNSLTIFYRYVPSVTHFPVYMGHIDRLLAPYAVNVSSDELRVLIRDFLIHLDRTFGSSYCHMNIGPRDTAVGRVILELLPELNNTVPNFTLIYDPSSTPDDFAELAIKTSLYCANPAFAYHPAYDKDYKGDEYGICSCYNALPIAGGAYTLSRIRMSKLAAAASSKSDFTDNLLPKAVETLCRFMESKIRFLVRESPFFCKSFLVLEDFVDKERFVGLFGISGLHECVDTLMRLEGKNCVFGSDEEANLMGIEVLKLLDGYVNGFISKYSKYWGHRFMLHAQVGGQNDEGTSPGARVRVGNEPPLYEHLRQAGMYHSYFPSGAGDIFPFETTARRNPAAVLDIFKGAFSNGMRYISTYSADSDLVRITGYLAKKSEIDAIGRSEAAYNNTAATARQSYVERGVANRKVREL